MTTQEYLDRSSAIRDDFRYDWKTRDAMLDALTEQAHRELAVGDGVTIRLYSDHEAYTVIKRTPGTITIQRDKVTLDPDFKPQWIPGGFSAICTNADDQRWIYERNTDGSTLTLRFSKKHGRFMYLGKAILIGRSEYYDYNF